MERIPEGTCRIVSKGEALNTSVDVWTGDRWLPIRGVFGLRFTVDARPDDRGGAYSGMALAELTIGLLQCEITVPIGKVRLEDLATATREIIWPPG